MTKYLESELESHFSDYKEISELEFDRAYAELKEILLNYRSPQFNGAFFDRGEEFKSYSQLYSLIHKIKYGLLRYGGNENRFELIKNAYLAEPALLDNLKSMLIKSTLSIELAHCEMFDVVTPECIAKKVTDIIDYYEANVNEEVAAKLITNRYRISSQTDKDRKFSAVFSVMKSVESGVVAKGEDRLLR